MEEFTYPVAAATEENFVNAKVYLQNKKEFHISDKLCKVPIFIARNKRFKGVTPTTHPEIVYIIEGDSNKLTKSTTFLCLKCNETHQGSITNAERHIDSDKHKKHNNNLLTNESAQVAISLLTKHRIPLNVFYDPLFHLLVPGFGGKSYFEEMINETFIVVKNKIKEKIQQAIFITPATDGWSSNTGRRLGISINLTYPDGGTETRVIALEEADENTLGAKEITSIISNTLIDYQIGESKVKSLLSDSAADMICAAKNLGLLSDHCYNHIISNIIEAGLKMLPERFLNLFTIAGNLHLSAKWKEYFNRQYKPNHPQFFNRDNFCESNDTRWGTKLNQILDLLFFKDPITEFYLKEGINLNPSKHFLPSDFQMMEELKHPFLAFLCEIKELQEKSNASRSSRFTFSLLRILSIAHTFIENKEEERKRHQEQIDKKCSKESNANSNSRKVIIPQSHLIPAFKKIKDLVIENFINNRGDCELYMKAAFVLDPAMPLINLPDQFEEEFIYTLQWIEGKCLENSRTNTEKQSQPGTDQLPKSETQQEKDPKPYHSFDVHAPSSQEDQFPSSLKYFLERIRPINYHVKDPLVFWINQPPSALRNFAIEAFSHRVSNASLEGFFSLCRSILGLNGCSMSAENLKTIAILSANRDIIDDEIIKPIKKKYY